MTTIRLPWPPSATSPNAKGQGNWRKKTDAARSYKNTCTKECWAQKVQKINASSVSVAITFHPPKEGKYDLDNALARAKQGLDAVAEQIGVDDANWSEMRLSRGEKVKGGCVVVKIIPPVVNIEHRGVIRCGEWQSIGDLAAKLTEGQGE